MAGVSQWNRGPAARAQLSNIDSRKRPLGAPLYQKLGFETAIRSTGGPQTTKPDRSPTRKLGRGGRLSYITSTAAYERGDDPEKHGTAFGDPTASQWTILYRL